MRQREANHEYRMLHCGHTWGGTRGELGNGEYDYPRVCLLHLARSADRRWFFRAEKAARGAIDVDTCHYAPPRGGNPRFGLIAMRAARQHFADGLDSIAYLRWTHHLLHRMDPILQGQENQTLPWLARG